MNMEFEKKLPIPKEVKEMFPVSKEMRDIFNKRNEEIKNILSGKDSRLLLIIGPCSADREDSVLDYIYRLRGLQEKVKDKIYIIPRVYTNKPRTNGEGHKGLLHQPNPNEKPNIFNGIIACRELHMEILKETEFTCADEILYPENHKYFDDILGYAAIGARSVEDQQHRFTASGLEIPVGMKNPTSGDLNVMINAISAAQNGHSFIYRGWAVHSQGNPYAHAILRGYINRHEDNVSNYHYEDILKVSELYHQNDSLLNPSIIIDTNHSNSNKNPFEQPRIIKEVLYNYNNNSEIKKIIKGFMVESYIEDGKQSVDGGVYGQSITDACLGWNKTEKLIYKIADSI